MNKSYNSKQLHRFIVVLLISLLSGCSINEKAKNNYWQRAPQLGMLMPLALWCSPFGNIYLSNTGGVYVSTDNGKTWVNRTEGLQYTMYIYSFTGYLNGNVFAGGRGITRTSNEGVIWEKCYGGSDWGDVVSLFIDRQNNFWAGSEDAGLLGAGGLYKSSDSGQTFSSYMNGIVDSIGAVRAIACDSKGTIFIATDAGMYRSSNYGTVWVKVNSITEKRINSISIINNDYIFTGGSFLYRSIDGGITWDKLNCGSDRGIVYIAATFRGDVFVGTGGGVYYSNNFGSTWEELNSGLPTNPHITCMMIDSSKHIYVGVLNDYLYKSITPLR